MYTCIFGCIYEHHIQNKGSHCCSTGSISKRRVESERWSLYNPELFLSRHVWLVLDERLCFCSPETHGRPVYPLHKHNRNAEPPARLNQCKIQQITQAKASWAFSYLSARDAPKWKFLAEAEQNETRFFTFFPTCILPFFSPIA